MARWSRAVLVVLMALAASWSLPAQVDARAGGHYSFGGGSFLSQGSRGSRTYSGGPMQQSTTPRPAPGFGTPGPYGYGTYHPFWTGLAGAFFGSWLGSLLFPHWGYGFGFGHFLGGIVSLLVLLWLVRLAVRAMGLHAMAGPSGLGYGAGFGAGAGLSPTGAGPAPALGAPLAIAGADYAAFEGILQHVQGAWSRGDINGMRGVMTPEMVSYFADTLAENQSRGVENHVENVVLVKGDLREAWDEGRMQYATCYLRWRAVDYTQRLDRRPGDPDYVVDGDPHNPTEAAELWTFARSPGGRWLLSAIQQV